MREEIFTLYAKMKMNGITQKKLTSQMNVSEQYFSAVIHDKEKPAPDFAERMKSALDVLIEG